MLFTNPRAARTAYPASLKDILSVERTRESRDWLSGWDQLSPGPTPLWRLSDLAQHLGIAQLFVKDESTRSPLGSFKALGASIALVRLIVSTMPEAGFDAKALIAGRYKDRLGDFVAISATDGNHGRSLAAAAQSIGCQCVIVLHANVSHEREQAIAHYGARIIRIKGGYDESVEHAAQLAREYDWRVVSDTSYEGYETVPRDVMQGYGMMVGEIIEQTAEEGADKCAFTHVFLQGGVGGLAAGIVSYFWEVYGANRPVFVIVEPEQANCLYMSAVHGRPSKATGSVDSVMAGLACGEASPLAWRFLEKSVDFFQTISDDAAIQAMKTLSRGSDADIPVVAGESGVAGLAALQNLAAASQDAVKMGLNRQSRVLMINTEGATAPTVYRELVGESAESVLGRQRAWRG